MISKFSLKPAASALGRIAAVWPRFAAAALAALAPLLTPASAQDDAINAARYNECIALANSEPERAVEYAAQWRALGGQSLARHCRAIALIAIGAEMNAARELTEIGVEGVGFSETDRIGALLLAGELWLRLEQPELARDAFAAAGQLGDVSRRRGIGAARAEAMLGAWPGAIAALDPLIAREPSDVEALTLRAAARRRDGDAAGALADATDATSYAPDIALSWFERGAAEEALGDIDAARSSWIKASELDPNGFAGELARANLQRDALGE